MNIFRPYTVASNLAYLASVAAVASATAFTIQVTLSEPPLDYPIPSGLEDCGLVLDEDCDSL